MAEIPLLGRDGKVRAMTQVDDEDFERIMAFGPWHLSGGYVTKTVGLHRFVALGHDLNSPLLIDHVDRDPLNNRRGNLREADASMSAQNRGTWGKSRYRGVYPLHGKWAAAGRKDGVRSYLGSYDDEDEAAAVAAAWRAENLVHAGD